jgi:transcriptional regulator with XRE-family HTH domain
MARKKKTPEAHSVDAALEPLSQFVCDRVRQLRKQKGWTLEQLASLSNVSRSMISQIERRAANPTLGVAFRLAQAFGIRLGDLVDIPVQATKIEVIRQNDRASLFRDDDQCRIRTLSPLNLEKDVEFYELVLKAGGTLKSAAHFEGTREFLTVEKGSIRVTSGDDVSELSTGDSAHYSADVDHALENSGRREAVAFLVVIYNRVVK